VFPSVFVPDGRALITYGDVGGSGQDDISIVSLEGAGQLAPLLHSTFAERNPDLLPDGRWLAYESDESGQLEIYVRPFPDVDGGRWQVSTDGGSQPLWARNGRELFFRAGDAVIVVPVEAGSGFAPGSPTVLFEGQYAETLGGRNYDVSPDGQRFLMLKESGPDGGAAQARFIVVENWFEELRQRVPTI
jgi:hypothetical protein